MTVAKPLRAGDDIVGTAGSGVGCSLAAGDAGPIGFHLALMAKAPVAGFAKTRLAPALGHAGAAALAERLLGHAVAQAAAAQPSSITLWVAPDASHPAFVHAQSRHHAQLRLQPAGDLGLRMARVFGHAFGRATGDRRDPDSSPAQGASPVQDRALPVLLMGTDAPALDAAMLQQAARALASHDAVFVPALDGGYALVGLSQAAPALLAALFSGMRWSHGGVMAETRLRLQAGGWRHAELAPVSDIDEPADLAHLPPGWLPAAPTAG